MSVMSFGEILLKKLGWREGKGLGPEETGIKTALRPKLKFDRLGFGCNKFEDFTFHWWDHIYNKAAKNISVNKNEAGEIYLTKAEEIKISNKKPHKEKVKKAICYGHFIKGSVLQGSTEISEDKPTAGDNRVEASERSQELMKYFSDDELFKFCGGLTAHKGARHGLTMSAKLARLQHQEKAFVTGQINSDENTPNADGREAKTKKRKLKMDQEETSVGNNEDISTMTDDDCKLDDTSGKSKKKKDRYSQVSDGYSFDGDSEIMHKMKKKKHKHNG